MNKARGPRATLPTIRITYRVVEETIINQGTSTICMWEWEHAAKHSILDVIGGRIIGTPPTAETFSHRFKPRDADEQNETVRVSYTVLFCSIPWR